MHRSIDESKKRRVARRTLGLTLLLVTVFLWTASNFLQSAIYADDSYSKPYFVTYLATAFFAVPLLPMLLVHAFNGVRPFSYFDARLRETKYQRLSLNDPHDESPSRPPDEREDLQRLDSNAALLRPIAFLDRSHASSSALVDSPQRDDPLTLRGTAKLSLEFCILWANYLSAACLQFTTVASSTILVSTSSLWTLLFGSIVAIERFTFRKLLGVLCTLFGIIIISTTDLSAPDNDDSRGSFPHKNSAQLALGDAMALVSAILYGLYAVLMKKRIGNESRVSMPLFFGLVGLFNVLLLWPGLFILHLTGAETFQLPPTRRIWSIVLINCISALASDFAWAYAMLLISPLVVTVGLSLTIPLSLIGQMVLNDQRSSVAYWIGAMIVFVGFGFVERISDGGDGQQGRDGFEEAGENETADQRQS